MTDIDIDAIRARLDGVTTGPWRADDKQNATGPDLWQRRIVKDYETEDGLRESEVCAVEYQTGGFHYPHADALADAEFIAHARQDIPALLDEIQRLREQVDADVAWRNAEAVAR